MSNNYDQISRAAHTRRVVAKVITYALLILFAIVLTITVINLMVSRKTVHY